MANILLYNVDFFSRLLLLATYITCTLRAHYVYITCSFRVHYVLITCTLRAHSVYITCSLRVHYMCIIPVVNLTFTDYIMLCSKHNCYIFLLQDEVVRVDQSTHHSILLLQWLYLSLYSAPSMTLSLTLFCSFNDFISHSILLLQWLYPSLYSAPSMTLSLTPFCSFNDFISNSILLLQWLYLSLYSAPSMTLSLTLFCSFNDFISHSILLLQWLYLCGLFFFPFVAMSGYSFLFPRSLF